MHNAHSHSPILYGTSLLLSNACPILYIASDPEAITAQEGIGILLGQPTFDQTALTWMQLLASLCRHQIKDVANSSSQFLPRKTVHPDVLLCERCRHPSQASKMNHNLTFRPKDPAEIAEVHGDTQSQAHHGTLHGPIVLSIRERASHTSHTNPPSIPVQEASPPRVSEHHDTLHKLPLPTPNRFCLPVREHHYHGPYHVSQPGQNSTAALRTRILTSIDYYFMLQIELIAPKDMLELQDMWQRVIDDVDDLVSTVGIAAAEALVEGLLGDDWKVKVHYENVG